MSTIGDKEQKTHSSYNKLNSMIKADINPKNNEDIKHLINKSMRSINHIRNNNFFQLNSQEEKSKNDNNKTNVKSKIYNKIVSLKTPKTELQPNNRREMDKKLIIDNNEEQKTNDENIYNISNRVLVKQKEYKGTKNENIIFYPLSDYKIEPIINDSKFNYFFILVIPQKLMDSIKISVHEKKNFFTGENNVQSYYILYQINFIGETNGTKLNEDLKYILVQVPVRNNTAKLIVMIEINKTQETYIGEIYNKTNISNYFYSMNVFYAMNMYNLSINRIFQIYLQYFFEENNTNDEKLKTDLLLSLIEHIRKSNIF